MAWGKIRSFESGINHISPVALGGGGEDGAIDILLVGMDSRTDAHGNPLSARGAGHAAGRRRRSDQHRHHHLGAHPEQREVRHRDLDSPRLLRRGARHRQDEDQRRLRRRPLGEAEAARRARGHGSGTRPNQQATEAGREALIKTVANLTGVTVDHYAEIGLLGFSLITDALGGVDVCLKDAVYEPLSGADFPAGWQKLDGPQALSFVRQRHDLPRGDLDRVTRQQAVMASLAHEVISSKTLSSPATLNRLQAAVQRSVVLSDGWDIMDFAEQLQKLAAGNVAFATIPVLEENGWSDDGMQSVVRVDPAEVKEWVASLLHDQDEGKTEELAYTPTRPPPTWSTPPTSTDWPPRCRKC